mmetsp:Transcript_2884/g.10491  ORF Transcript_2884/g.10491 Transcript_2884/m.10491 type:complete len:135 (+) Transcript_2884:686-1090(+)
MAVIQGLGSKFIATFLPEFGFEQRVPIESLAGVTISHDTNAGELNIAHDGAAVQSRRARKATEARERAAAKAAAATTEASAGDDEEPRVHLLNLPAKLGIFDRIPIRLSAKFSKGKPPETTALLLISAAAPEGA